MPYKNEHSCRLKDPKQYDRFRRENDKFGKGIHAIWGIKKDKAELQSIRFDAKKFTVVQAKAWLKKHKIKYILFEPAAGSKNEGEHFRILCSQCNKIIAQCRCTSSNKTITYELCEECKSKKKVEEFLVKCPSCKKVFNFLSEPESHMGYVKCPGCGSEVGQAAGINPIEMKKDVVNEAAVPGIYNIKNKEFDEVVILNFSKRDLLIRTLKKYCKKYFVIDYQFTTSTQKGEHIYFFYSMILFLQKKHSQEEPTKEAPLEVEETK